MTKECTFDCNSCEFGLADLIRSWINAGEAYGDAKWWFVMWPDRCSWKFKKATVASFILDGFFDEASNPFLEEKFDQIAEGFENLYTQDFTLPPEVKQYYDLRRSRGVCKICISEHRYLYEFHHQWRTLPYLVELAKKNGEEITEGMFSWHFVSHYDPEKFKLEYEKKYKDRPKKRRVHKILASMDEKSRSNEQEYRRTLRLKAIAKKQKGVMLHAFKDQRKQVNS